MCIRDSVYGEGPTQVPEGAFTDVDRPKFTGADIRFTYKPGYVYALSLIHIYVRFAGCDKIARDWADRGINTVSYTHLAVYFGDEVQSLDAGLVSRTIRGDFGYDDACRRIAVDGLIGAGERAAGLSLIHI